MFIMVDVSPWLALVTRVDMIPQSTYKEDLEPWL